MEYKIIDAFNMNDKTILSLDSKRIVQDLGSNDSVIEGIHYRVFSVHPDEFVVISQVNAPENLIGKIINLIN